MARNNASMQKKERETRAREKREAKVARRRAGMEALVREREKFTRAPLPGEPWEDDIG